MTMHSSAYQLTPEQIALSRERKLKKQSESQQATALESTKHDPRGDILPRQWLKVREVAESSAHALSVKVMSWNMLAQCLVRRELFPTSDCLKGAQREHMLYREIQSLNADICCLQEVDRTEKLFPILENAGYACTYSKGPRKNHGCLIAFRKDRFAEVDSRTVFYDDEEVRDSTTESEKVRKASTRITKNIANITALQHQDHPEDGVIVATTHLFWHPRFTYERARQTGILLREVDKFRQKIGKPEWPCIVAGDLNFQPNDATYSLLVGDPLLPDQIENLAISRVVHITIDPSAQPAAPAVAAAAEEDEESGGGQSDPDKIITNARKARPDDGLLSDSELVQLFKYPRAPVSAYDSGLQSVNSERKVHELTFGSRVAVPPGRHGAHEPVYTSYTHYWKTVLDYIFVLDTPTAPVSVLALAAPHTADKFVDGLPRKGVCGSDHVSLGAELSWPSSSSTVRV